MGSAKIFIHYVENVIMTNVDGVEITHEREGVLDYHYTIRNAKKSDVLFHFNRLKKPDDMLNLWMKQKQKEEEMGAGSYIKRIDVMKLTPVTQTVSRWYNGEYYAHEYDAYLRGAARRIQYSNGYTEYVVKCLDPGYSVADGIWEDYTNNGCGDSFELTERARW